MIGAGASVWTTMARAAVVSQNPTFESSGAGSANAAASGRIYC